MVIFVADEPREVMLNYELIDEGPAVPRNHRHKPNARDRESQGNAPDKAKSRAGYRPFAAHNVVQSNHAKNDHETDQPFGEKRKTSEEIEADQQDRKRRRNCRTAPSGLRAAAGGLKKGEGSGNCHRQNNVEAGGARKPYRSQTRQPHHPAPVSDLPCLDGLLTVTVVFGTSANPIDKEGR